MFDCICEMARQAEFEYSSENGIYDEPCCDDGYPCERCEEAMNCSHDKRSDEEE